MRKPNALAHPSSCLRSTWPDSTLQNNGLLSWILPESSIFPPYSLVFLSPQLHTLSRLPLALPHIPTCLLNLAGFGCAHSRTQSHSLVGASDICLCLATQSPAQDCFGCPRSPELPSTNTADFTSLHILQHSIIFYCVFLPIATGRLGGMVYSNSTPLSTCQKPAWSHSTTQVQNEQVFSSLRLVTLERPRADHESLTYPTKLICVWLMLLTISI